MPTPDSNEDIAKCLEAYAEGIRQDVRVPEALNDLLQFVQTWVKERGYPLEIRVDLYFPLAGPPPR